MVQMAQRTHLRPLSLLLVLQPVVCWVLQKQLLVPVLPAAQALQEWLAPAWPCPWLPWVPQALLQAQPPLAPQPLAQQGCLCLQHLRQHHCSRHHPTPCPPLHCVPWPALQAVAVPPPSA